MPQVPNPAHSGNAQANTGTDPVSAPAIANCQPNTEGVDANFQETIDADRKAAEEVMSVMRTWIKAEAENTTFMVKSHPKGRHALEFFSNKIIEMLEKFIVEDEIPQINVNTDLLEKSFSGFWAKRAKKQKVVRERI